MSNELNAMIWGYKFTGFMKTDVFRKCVFILCEILFGQWQLIASQITHVIERLTTTSLLVVKNR